jgi:hypothetical protein
MYPGRSALPLSFTGWKPPQIMRLPSKGASFIDSVIAESLRMLSLALSRVALSGYSTHEKITSSSPWAFTERLKSVTVPSGTSSPQFSTRRVAPSFLK